MWLFNLTHLMRRKVLKGPTGVLSGVDKTLTVTKSKFSFYGGILPSETGSRSKGHFGHNDYFDLGVSMCYKVKLDDR
jgi:hypothetical protein